MNKRERRCEKRSLFLGPKKALVEIFDLNGCLMEKLECGHEFPHLYPRTSKTPGKVFRRCSSCKELEVLV